VAAKERVAAKTAHVAVFITRCSTHHTLLYASDVAVFIIHLQRMPTIETHETEEIKEIASHPSRNLFDLCV